MRLTRVGYAGGEHPDPTYHDLGDHAEALQVDFDPERIGFEGLMEEFVTRHDPCRAPFRGQYRSAVLFHDAEQEVTARRVLARVEAERGAPVATEVRPFHGFTLAEDYHQKYLVRRDRELVAELERRFPTREAFLGSPLVTRLNALLGGHLAPGFLEELPRSGLPPALVERLLRDHGVAVGD